MKDIKINKIIIIIGCNHGEVSEVKFNALNQCLGELVENSYGDINMLTYELKNNNQLLIENNSIKYCVMENEFNKSVVKETLDKVFERLMLGNNISITLDLQGTSESENYCKELIDMYKGEVNKIDRQLAALGYRFLFEGKGFKDDLRVEPLFADNNFLFHQLIRSYDFTNDLDGVLNNLEKIYEDADSYLK